MKTEQSPTSTDASTSADHVVLLVDDEPNLLHAVVRFLRQRCYQIYTARSAEEGQDILKSHHVDLVVSDENMAGMSGSEFLSWVADEFPQTVRILLTGDPYVPSALCAVNEGIINRYFTKPCSLAELALAIRHTLEDKDRCQEGVARGAI